MGKKQQRNNGTNKFNFKIRVLGEKVSDQSGSVDVSCHANLTRDGSHESWLSDEADYDWESWVWEFLCCKPQRSTDMYPGAKSVRRIMCEFLRFNPEQADDDYTHQKSVSEILCEWERNDQGFVFHKNNETCFYNNEDVTDIQWLERFLFDHVVSDMVGLSEEQLSLAARWLSCTFNCSFLMRLSSATMWYFLDNYLKEPGNESLFGFCYDKAMPHINIQISDTKITITDTCTVDKCIIFKEESEKVELRKRRSLTTIMTLDFKHIKSENLSEYGELLKDVMVSIKGVPQNAENMRGLCAELQRIADFEPQEAPASLRSSWWQVIVDFFVGLFVGIGKVLGILWCSCIGHQEGSSSENLNTAYTQHSHQDDEDFFLCSDTELLISKKYR